MIHQRARALGTMSKQLFFAAVGLGAVTGALTVIVMFDPVNSAASLDLEFLFTILPIALLCGVGVGVLSWAGTYAALGILEFRAPEATALLQAAGGGLGSMAGGLLPALVIFTAVLSEDPDVGIIYSLSGGLLAVCFALAFGVILVLNRSKNN